MDFERTTILGLFDGSQKQFSIPLYQRAYSWKRDNWEIFYSDIIEACNSKNPYFYGNILLETIEDAKLFDIIDGQQRITTLILFFYSISLVSKINRGI